MNQNKIDSMEAVGELVDHGNLLLQENGFPHVSQSDVWNEAGTKPTENRVYQTRLSFGDDEPLYQHWNGEFFGFENEAIQSAYLAKDSVSPFQEVQWREVQP